MPPNSNTRSSYIPPLPPNPTPENLNATLNAVIDQINANQRTQVLSDGTSNRFLFGYQKGGFPGGDFGMKISPPGVDVKTAALSQLLFYWDFTAGTQYWNDFAGRNYRQDGTLPDGTTGFVIAQSPFSVAEAYNG